MVGKELVNHCWDKVLSYRPSIDGPPIQSISEIKGLSELHDLQHLDLENNHVSEISGLENLTSLRELNLDGNKIIEIKGLDALVNLEYLNLSDNLITEIKKLDCLPKLRNLALSDNRITELKGLDKLVNLRQLTIENNKISEFKGLEFINLQTTLYFDGNPINKEEEKYLRLPSYEAIKFCRQKAGIKPKEVEYIPRKDYFGDWAYYGPKICVNCGYDGFYFDEDLTEQQSYPNHEICLHCDKKYETRNI